MAKCTAHKQNGEPCNNSAVPGYTVCRFHGAGGGKPIKSGIYSSKVRKSLEESYQDLMDNVDQLTELNDDIALLRALMIDTLKEEPQNEAARTKQMMLALKFMNDIRATVKLKDEIDSKYTVPIETIHIFLNQLIWILKQTISDQTLLNHVLEQLRGIKLLDYNHPQLISERAIKERKQRKLEAEGLA